VVVGYDGRRLSREMAEDTAAILTAAGLRAHLFQRTVPTPLTAFAVRHLNAAAGVMITASHNPPEYNGYKVYWSNGAQIIPPVDIDIARRIDAAPAANKIPRPTLDRTPLYAPIGDDVERAYLDRVRALEVNSGGDRDITIVYTPLHGTGGRQVTMAMHEAGFQKLAVVPEQEHPDGSFPTVAFPNPEEKGAMDLAFALASKTRAHLVLANDPDADRLAIAVPSGDRYVQLTGNQVGVLLGHYLLTEKPAKGPRLVIASIVSSPLLGHIARALGVRYEETLTGFKWIANKAIELGKSGYEFVFGYEEALGYTVGDLVRDKDGVSAAVIAAEMCAVLRSRQKTLLDELEVIHRKYGLYVSSQVNITRKGASGQKEIRELMDRLRVAPPSRVGDLAVEAISDYEAQLRTILGTSEKPGSTAPLELPRSNVLAFDLEGGSRIIARPSGTEPKVKFYFDVREVMSDAEPLASAETRAAHKTRALEAAFVKVAGVS
jgi:phosphomannomutase